MQSPDCTTFAAGLITGLVLLHLLRGRTFEPFEPDVRETLKSGSILVAHDGELVLAPAESLVKSVDDTVKRVTGLETTSKAHAQQIKARATMGYVGNMIHSLSEKVKKTYVTKLTAQRYLIKGKGYAIKMGKGNHARSGPRYMQGSRDNWRVRYVHKSNNAQWSLVDAK